MLYNNYSAGKILPAACKLKRCTQIGGKTFRTESLGGFLGLRRRNSALLRKPARRIFAKQTQQRKSLFPQRQHTQIVCPFGGAGRHFLCYSQKAQHSALDSRE